MPLNDVRLLNDLLFDNLFSVLKKKKTRASAGFCTWDWANLEICKDWRIEAGEQPFGKGTGGSLMAR